MAIDLAQYEKQAKRAVKLFWNNRHAAIEQQREAGDLDRGTRGAVTGGKNMDGFGGLVADLVEGNGLKNA